ncbi:hypothetical protein [Sulfurisphaera ohwakuensis]
MSLIDEYHLPFAFTMKRTISPQYTATSISRRLTGFLKTLMIT